MSDVDPQAVKRGGRSYPNRRPLGLAKWKPQAPTLPLVAAISQVLDEYRDFWPLTARQVYYRLIGLPRAGRQVEGRCRWRRRQAQPRPTSRDVAVGGDPG